MCTYALTRTSLLSHASVSGLIQHSATRTLATRHTLFGTVGVRVLAGGWTGSTALHVHLVWIFTHVTYIVCV